MFVAALSCAAGHAFDGWFERSGDVDAALASGDVACPTCGSAEVVRRPAFRGIGKRAEARTAPPPSTTPEGKVPLDVQRFLSKVHEVVRRHGEDVGEAFSARARAIYRGEEPARLIYGRSTPEEERVLVEEGVPFSKLPIPDIDVN